jgi:1-deoxy-D-xylulose-5-phosphate reductoisomerase
MAARSISILGSTGSIGTSTLDLINCNRSRFSVAALTAYNNIDLLIEQVRVFKPQLAVIGDETHYDRLKTALQGSATEAAAGRAAIIEAAEVPSDFVMAGIVGAAGLKPTLAAVRRGAIVGLANKECLVCAGDLIMKEVAKHGATLLPVDSEHNAIYQVFDFEQAKSVRKIILTASGGPFRSSSLEVMRKATPEQAVLHPNWDMGAKISVDSATMMNKGLELIEAYHLFPVAKDQVEILVHPESVVHSLVEYEDGSFLAQLGSPDMRTPISYALNWPKRMNVAVDRLDLAKIRTLNFETVDGTRFPAVEMARHVLMVGGSAPVILNAANEIAVRGFLERKIGFLDICNIVGEVLAIIDQSEITSVGEVIEVDELARNKAKTLMNGLEV